MLWSWRARLARLLLRTVAWTGRRCVTAARQGMFTCPRGGVHRYNAEGIDGLANRGGGGAKPRLTPEQMAQFAAWVEAGPEPARDGVVRWRRADLARRIEVEFGIRYHERTVGKHLDKLGFRRLSVRPEHPNADPAAQATFKKTSKTS